MLIERNHIKSTIYEHKTLGLQSSFEYTQIENQLFIRFGRMIKFLSVKNEIIDKINDRVNYLRKEGERLYKSKASLYNKPNWKECPNNRISVYVACLIINNKIN